MTISGRELARRVDGRVEVRSGALRCRLPLRGIATADQHQVDLTFTFSVIPLSDHAERQMLAETFLSGRDSVGVEEITAHFSQAISEAASREVATQPAEHWLAESNRPGLIELLRDAAKPVAFISGVELVSPFELAIESPTLQREKLEATQRRLVERRAAGQVEHVQRASELLKQFQSLRDAAPGLPPGKILDQVSPADRGSLLQTLLLASASGESKSLWAVAGPNLVKIDPREVPHRCEMMPLPGELGPLRSVQGAVIEGAARLLIGAQSGVMLIDPQNPSAAIRFADREVTSPLGFNSVIATADLIWATHGDAGVVAWRLDSPDVPAFTLRPQALEGGAKNAVALDDQQILYSIGGNAFIARADGTSNRLDGTAGSVGTSAAIIHIAVDAETIALIRADGTVDQLDRTTLARTQSEKRAGEITAAATLPWLGTTRLLLATADGPVCCVGSDDPLVTQYLSVHRGLRALAATSDLVAGVSGDRQRIVVWNSWEGRTPSSEIHIGSIARHRAADIAFV